MQVEYGPPGVSGVTHLMYLAGDEENPQRQLVSRIARGVGAIGAVSWLLAFTTGDKRAASRALKVSIGGFVVSLLAR